MHQLRLWYVLIYISGGCTRNIIITPLRRNEEANKKQSRAKFAKVSFPL